MAYIEEAMAVAVCIVKVEHGCLLGGGQLSQGVPRKGTNLAPDLRRKGALLVYALDHEELGALLLQVDLDAVLGNKTGRNVKASLFPDLHHIS